MPKQFAAILLVLKENYALSHYKTFTTLDRLGIRQTLCFSYLGKVGVFQTFRHSGQDFRR